MTSERKTRPELERSEPVRDWSTMFRASSGDGSTHSGGNGHGSAGNASEPETREADRDVAMGYRVVEEYMRRGAAAARQMSEGISSGPDSRAANQLFERLLQSATDLGGVWIEMLQTLWSSQAPDVPRGEGPGSFELHSAPAQRDAPAAEASSANAKQSPAIAFRVHGGRSVELSATLSAEPHAGQQWIVHDLRALDPSVPRIERAHFEYQPDQSRCVIALDIPAEQPAGMYSGLIVDAESNLPRGTVSVRLLA